MRDRIDGVLTTLALLAPLALYQRSALAAQADVRRKIARFVAYGA